MHKCTKYNWKLLYKFHFYYSFHISTSKGYPEIVSLTVFRTSYLIGFSHNGKHSICRKLWRIQSLVLRSLISNTIMCVFNQNKLLLAMSICTLELFKDQQIDRLYVCMYTARTISKANRTKKVQFNRGEIKCQANKLLN